MTATRPSVMSRLVLVSLFVLAVAVASDASDGDEADVLSSDGGLRQIVGLIPSAATPTIAAYFIEWVELRWPGNHINSTDKVTMRKADLADPEIAGALGAWADVDFVDVPIPTLTCRTDPETNNYLTCLERRNNVTTPLDNGCCGDTLKIYDRVSGSVWAISTVNAIQSALAADGVPQEDLITAYATHTMDVHYRDGVLYYILVVRYNCYSQLGGMYADAAVKIAVDVSEKLPEDSDDPWLILPDAVPLPTASGLMSFIPIRDVSTWSTDPADSIYKVQFTPAVTNEDGEEWHMNGLLTFEDTAGNKLLGVSLRYQNGPFIIADPWEVADMQILQRFGTPFVWSETGEILDTHFFGLEPAEENVMLTGCHNLWYTLYPDGKETITIFSNHMGEDGLSKAVEFDLKLAPQTADTVLEDSVFETNYSLGPLPFEAWLQGGARPIGDGVYVASTGFVEDGSYMGLVVTDTEGNYDYVPYDMGGVSPMYDCFTFIDIEEAPLGVAADE